MIQDFGYYTFDSTNYMEDDPSEENESPRHEYFHEQNYINNRICGFKRSADNIELNGDSQCSQDVVSAVFGASLLNACRTDDRESFNDIISGIYSLLNDGEISGKNCLKLLNMQDCNNRTFYSYVSLEDKESVSKIKQLVVALFYEVCKRRELSQAYRIFNEFQTYDIKYKSLNDIVDRRTYPKIDIKNINDTIKAMFRLFPIEPRHRNLFH